MNSLIHEGVIFIFCLLPLSSQRGAAGGYGDGEWGQWDRHRGLLATPSRRGAERGGPGVQGNNETAAQQLPEVGDGVGGGAGGGGLMGWGRTRIVGTRTKETQTGMQTDLITKTLCRRGRGVNSRLRRTFCSTQLPTCCCCCCCRRCFHVMTARRSGIHG